MVRAAQEVDASKVRVFQQFFTLKYADFLSLLLLILHHHNLNFHTSFGIKNFRLFDKAIQRAFKLSHEQYSVLINHCMLGNTLK